MTAPVDVLALGAHPDDVELGCGGALLLAARAGLPTAIVDFTAGERAGRGTEAKRAAERDTAGAVLEIRERICLGFPDGELMDTEATRQALILEIRRLRPRVVLAPVLEDRHPDHGAVGKTARAACFLSGVAAIGAGSPHRPSQIFHYPIHQPTNPSFVVDVTTVWDQKWRAITAYESQFEKDAAHGEQTALSSGSFLRVVEARSVLAGGLVGVERGEPYWSAGPIGVEQLPGLGADVLSYRSFV